MVASRVPPIGDLAHNPGMCPDWESNWGSFGSQASTQSIELHQPGLILKEFLKKYLFIFREREREKERERNTNV